MSACCSGGCASEKPPVDTRFRRILWIALVVNAAMFFVELAGGWNAGSVSLLADAVDFFGDAANYGLSLFVLALAPVWRSRTALIKGLTMGGYGVFVLGMAGWNLAHGVMPEPATMGAIGFLALLANLAVAVLLFAYRNGDANMRSVWLCTRNDAIGNVAVMLAALGVFGTGSGWPDIIVAGVMGMLGLSAARVVVAQARGELQAAGAH
ncbi:cation diffusion facilitator family transporter [Noviherbaspirillum agri]